MFYKKYLQFQFLELEWQVLVEKKIVTCTDTSKCYRSVNQKIFSKHYDRGTDEYWQLMCFTQLMVLILSNDNNSWERKNKNMIISLLGNCEYLLGLPYCTFSEKIKNLPENAGFLDYNAVFRELSLFRFMIEEKGLRIRPQSDFIFKDAIFFWCLPADQAGAVHESLYLLSRQYRNLLNELF